MATLSNNKLEDWEIAKYWEIFSGLNPINGLLSGERAATVLKNSNLEDRQLEKIWDLADVDGDGNLDFEEFCVAMRLIFDLINGRYKDVPNTLPDWLIPSSKAHLVQANQAITTGGPSIDRTVDDFDDFDDSPSGLSSDFDWYMSPRDRSSYEAVYTANADRRGQITFDSLTELYGTINVPETDVISAWNLINPRADRTIGRDQTLAFLHILNNRNRGVRVPRNVPASLRATFDKTDKIDYDLSKPAARASTAIDKSTATGRKSAFAESYLDRLGISNGRTGYTPSGTDFSSTKDTDWEEVRLRRKLTELEAQLEKANSAAQRRKEDARMVADNSKIALVRSQLEQLYDYKRRQLRKLRSGEAQEEGPGGSDLQSMKQEIETLKQQVDMLEDYCNRKQNDLNRLYSDIEKERS
ncbi:actin cytoskeleton-regulatory complex protein END3-domain-containing protein [Limtongia smithiae]|uniref:actin cytoskeleton-regulatory complex protein END3-domain-containing protein n=1 Tax=Limtongia smithiae TaxID=1125753 RepID=UPI0034CD4535